MIKIVIFSEDHREGLRLEWPSVPRVGEFVAFNHPGGTDTLVVRDVRYHADTNGNLTEVELRLEY